MEYFLSCGCNSHEILERPEQPVSLTATQRVLTYRVDFSADLKTGGKAVPRADVLRWIQEALDLAYSDKLGIEFQRVTGGANYVFRIWNDPDPYAGTFRNNQSITLNARDPRGWPESKVKIIAVHELGHSWDFFGSGHNSGSFVEGGVRYSHVMHPDDGRTPKYARYPSLTSPEETQRLVRRYGVEPPKPEPPKPEPPKPEPPKPEPPKPEPPKVDPIKEELIKLRAERTTRQAKRVEIDKLLADLRQERKDLNVEIKDTVADRVANEDRIKEINDRIDELVASR